MVYTLTIQTLEPCDVDLYYLNIRKFKPRRIIEVGSGYSTMVCLKAMEQNKIEGIKTELTCIEPFEMPFLNHESNLTLIRTEVELVRSYFIYYFRRKRYSLH